VGVDIEGTELGISTKGTKLGSSTRGTELVVSTRGIECAERSPPPKLEFNTATEEHQPR
jgi:hypothetical protein